MRGRGRLASLLLLGTLNADALFRDKQALALIPEGKVLRVRRKLRIRHFRDAMYVYPFVFGEYESALSSVLAGCLDAGDVAVDVGANFGWYSILFAASVGPAGHVHAFEPIPALAHLAEDSLSVNAQTSHVTLNRVALGSQSGRLTLYTFAGLPHGHASASDLGRADAVAVECPVQTLDEYLAGCPRAPVAVLKLDVEGHELEVIRGATETLSRHDAPVVSFETNAACLRDRALDPEVLAIELRALGYTDLWRLDRTGKVSRVTRPLETEDADYLAAKPERAVRLVLAMRRRLVD